MPRLKNTLQACRAPYTYKNGFVGCLTPDTFICYEIFCDKIVLCPVCQQLKLVILLCTHVALNLAITALILLELK